MKRSDENKIIIKGARESLRNRLKDDAFAGGLMTALNKQGVTGDARYVILCDALLRDRKAILRTVRDLASRPWWKRIFAKKGTVANA